VISWTDFQTLKCTPPPGAFGQINLILSFAVISSVQLHALSRVPIMSQHARHRPPGHMHIHDHGYPAHLGVWRVVWFTVSRWRSTRDM
jgi:hypothetical protein